LEDAQGFRHDFRTDVVSGEDGELDRGHKHHELASRFVGWQGRSSGGPSRQEANCGGMPQSLGSFAVAWRVKGRGLAA
jgi:hypothetical protein